jgi:phosphoribosylaminoimidazolecarboxamide formyltransferase/IMP cyclohydrolase
MSELKGIRTALISVFYKDGLESIALKLHELGVTIYSTGGTQTFLEKLGIEVIAVEDLTSYPSILGGRVKTLHPKVFGGILSRRNESDDIAQLEEYDIPELDLVIVDLYPFQETIQAGASDEEIIEKIDIGGVSLIRAAAKNFNDVLVVSDRKQYAELNNLLINQQGNTRLIDRKQFAAAAFANISTYDNAISSWFADSTKTLRYGENPHQKGFFNGDLSKVFDQLHGKELSYNNLLDIDAALRLMADFAATGCAILKHNNACGAALENDALRAWKKALEADPVSAFGGVIIFNAPISKSLAEEIDTIFFEVLLAPEFSAEALQIFGARKNRILLQTKSFERPLFEKRTALNGLLVQQTDSQTEKRHQFITCTTQTPSSEQLGDLEFAAVLVKHTKSNAIVLVKDRQLLASGTGQTSRVDALNQAIDKAKRMNLALEGAVMASDAFFPFPDCVQISAEAGIQAIIQPGGSIKDQDSTDAANRLGIAMVTTGIRHFKH